MSARLFLAPTGQGKTEYVLCRIRAVRAEEPLAPIWVILPNHYGPVSIAVHWEEGEDEPWYLVTDVEATRATIRTYKVRMWIEEMFGDMKGHGVDLEATHLRDLDRLSRLVLGVCLAYVWLISVGSWVVKNGKRHWVDLIRQQLVLVEL